MMSKATTMQATLAFLVLLVNASEAFYVILPPGTFHGLASHRLPHRTLTARARGTATRPLQMTLPSPDENDATENQRDSDSKPSEATSESSISSSRKTEEVVVTADSIVSSIRQQKRSEEVLKTNEVEEAGTKYPINLPSPILLSASMVLAIAATGR